MTAETLTKVHAFVGQLQHASGQADQLRVSDLNVGLRRERLAEIGSWSRADLDLIEMCASRYGHDEPISSVLTHPTDTSAAIGASADPHCSPSPFAWF